MNQQPEQKFNRETAERYFDSLDYVVDPSMTDQFLLHASPLNPSSQKKLVKREDWSKISTTQLRSKFLPCLEVYKVFKQHELLCKYAPDNYRDGAPSYVSHVANSLSGRRLSSSVVQFEELTTRLNKEHCKT